MSPSAKLIHTSHMLRIEEDTFHLPNGSSVERTIIRHPGAAIILPISNAGIRLVRQYRYAVGETLYEVPAGTLEIGETPLECAKRELAEEAKFTAQRWEDLGTIYPTPGFCDEKQHLYAAFGLTPTAGQLDEDEILEYTDVTFVELEQLLSSGAIRDAKTLSIILLGKVKGFIPSADKQFVSL